MKKKTARPKSDIAGRVLLDIFSARVKTEGGFISAREAMIRNLYNRSLRGDIDASIEVQELRDASGSEEAPRTARRIVEENPPLDVWMRAAAEQQAPYREKGHGRDPD